MTYVPCDLFIVGDRVRSTDGLTEGVIESFTYDVPGDTANVRTADGAVVPVPTVRLDGWEGGRTYTDPATFTTGVAEGWAEAETDPTRIDWPARQAAAAIPFEVVGGRPVNPCETTAVRYGRNEMGVWGESLVADALVTCVHGGTRHLLMVLRDDGYGWAVPGGHVDPGETAVEAALRELAEETGYVAAFTDAVLEMPARYVPDPRASDEAWAVTVPVAVDLGAVAVLPAVSGGDDARRAEWVPAEDYADLSGVVARWYGGTVFAAHTDMLREFLDADAVDEGSLSFWTAMASLLAWLAALMFCVIQLAGGWHRTVTAAAAVVCALGLVASAVWLNRSAS